MHVRLTKTTVVTTTTITALIGGCGVLTAQSDNVESTLLTTGTQSVAMKAIPKNGQAKMDAVELPRAVDLPCRDVVIEIGIANGLELSTPESQEAFLELVLEELAADGTVGATPEETCRNIDANIQIKSHAPGQPDISDMTVDYSGHGWQVPMEQALSFGSTVDTPNWKITVDYPLLTTEPGLDIPAGKTLVAIPFEVTNTGTEPANPWSVIYGCWVVEDGDYWCESEITLEQDLFRVGVLEVGETGKGQMPILVPDGLDPESAVGAFALMVDGGTGYFYAPGTVRSLSGN